MTSKPRRVQFHNRISVRTRSSIINILKKIVALFFSTTIIFSFSAPASDSKTVVPDFTGFYVGPIFGPIKTRNKFSISTTGYLGVAGLPNSFYLTADTSKFSFAGGLHLGYGWEMGRFYIGTEAEGMFLRNSLFNKLSNVVSVGSPTEQTTQLRMTLQNEYGLLLRPGVILAQNVLLFGRLGIVGSEFTLNSVSFLVNNAAQNGPSMTSIEPSARQRIAALSLGLGVETKPINHFGIGVEYFYNNYGHLLKTTADQLGRGGSTPRLINDTKASVRNQGLLFNLSYYTEGHLARAIINSITNGFRGFYFGMQGGVSSAFTRSAMEISTFVNGARPNTQFLNGEFYRTGGVGGLQLGYGGAISAFYLGGELYGIVQRITIPSHVDYIAQFQAGVAVSTAEIIDTATRLNSEYGLDLKPGWLMASNVLLYGKIGILGTSASVQSDTVVNAPAGVQGTLTQSRRMNLFGWRAGIGLETLVSQSVSLGVEYTYTNFKPITISDTVPAPGAITRIYNKTAVTPYVQSIVGTLNYYFG